MDLTTLVLLLAFVIRHRIVLAELGLLGVLVLEDTELEQESALLDLHAQLRNHNSVGIAQQVRQLTVMVVGIQLKEVILAAADLATQPLAAHLDIQHARRLAFVMPLQATLVGLGAFGALVLEE